MLRSQLASKAYGARTIVSSLLAGQLPMNPVEGCVDHRIAVGSDVVRTQPDRLVDGKLLVRQVLPGRTDWKEVGFGDAAEPIGVQIELGPKHGLRWQVECRGRRLAKGTRIWMQRRPIRAEVAGAHRAWTHENGNRSVIRALDTLVGEQVEIEPDISGRGEALHLEVVGCVHPLVDAHRNHRMRKELS